MTQGIDLRTEDAGDWISGEGEGFGLRFCTVPGSQDDAGGDRWVRGLNLAQQEYCTMLIDALSSVQCMYVYSLVFAPHKLFLKILRK